MSQRYPPAMDTAQITEARLRGWLREQRVRAGYSQHDTAEALGLTQAAVSKIERGAIPLTVEAFLRIAEVIEVDPVDAIRAATISEMTAASRDIAV